MNRMLSRAVIALAAVATVGSSASGAFAQTRPAVPAFANPQAPPPERPDPLPAFFNPSLPLDRRVDDLLARVTLEEKIALMIMESPAIPRLGIGYYDWWSEALHGVAMNGAATVFPQAIGMSAAWDVDLQLEVAKVIGLEGRAKHAASAARNSFGRYKGLDFWSPNVNIARDPRWGRAQETYGEDPYLSGRLGIQFVKGLQGDDPFYFQVIATPKHFAVHSGPEPLRHEFDAVVTDQDLYTTYLPQFEATVREGKAYSVMSAYSAFDGIPAPASKRLLTDILRNQWGFKGYVVSDVDSVSDIYLPQSHAFAPSAVEASALAIKAGNDLNSGKTYTDGNYEKGPSSLAKAIAAGLVTEKEVDVSFRRLMEARIRMGLFDPPDYAGNKYNKITAEMNDLPESDAVARKMADKSMVLLKNANQTLPLKSNIGSIAVLGPNINSITVQYGNYNGTPSAQHRVSILEGIRRVVGEENVLTTTQRIPINANMPLAELVKGDYLFTDATKSRHGLTAIYAATPAGFAQPLKTEIVETGELKMPDASLGVAYDPTFAVRMSGVIVPPATGDYQIGVKAREGVKITLDGRVIANEPAGAVGAIAKTVSLEKDKALALVIEYTHNAKTGRIGAPTTNPGEVIPGDRPASRKIPTFGATLDAPGISTTPSENAGGDPLLQLAWTRPMADGSPANTTGESLYGEAVDLVKKANAVILVLGIDQSLEAEGLDRETIELPAVQEGLLKEAAKAAGNKPLIVVCCSGSAVALTSADQRASAIVQAWYPGQRGDAVADVLFGKYNPAGRLPLTFYKSTGDLPTFTDYAMYNRTYRYFTKPVLYPFGYGLSYSTFEYSSLVAPESSTTADDVKISFAVKNSSAIDGEEVVQCYINRDLPEIDPATVPTDPNKISNQQATMLSTPRKSLVGFARLTLKAGESKTVTFTVTPQQLSLVVGKDGKREVRAEKLQIQVGGSSAIGLGTLVKPLTIQGDAKTPEYRFVDPVIK